MSNAYRQAAIDHAFNKFITDDGNTVEAADLKTVYATNIHPRVVSGECSPDEAFLELLTNFNDRNNDGRVHREDWNAYYEKISANIANDEHFCQLMCQVWRI
jgi:hypothetical protein